jgi:hypothetical protein
LRSRLPVNKNYVTLNTVAQRDVESSDLEVYKRLMALKSKLDHHSGPFVTHVSQSGDVLAFGTANTNARIHVTVVNFSNEDDEVDLRFLFHPTYDIGYVEVARETGNNAEG